MNSRAIIFDLDDTIFATEEFKPYLRTEFGRETIPGLIERGEIEVRERHQGIVEYINKLINSGIAIFIFSDSPSAYCFAILDKGGVNVSRDNVYCSQHKPTVDDNNIFTSYQDILVVGDSPKDIYFAHLRAFPSILLGRLSKKSCEYYNRWTKPSAICTNLDELKSAVDDYLNGQLVFQQHDFKKNYDTVDPDECELTTIPSENMGHAFEYWPNSDDWDDVEDRKKVWFEVKRSIKVAKELTPSQIENSERVAFFNRNNTIGYGKAFKALMWVSFLEFLKWAKKEKLTGKIYLVPTPPSVPMECNKSFPMLILAEWWSKYAYFARKKGEINFILEHFYIVERFWPTPPAHMSNGRREVRPHLETLGTYKKITKNDGTAVIILDDIVTSGTQMNAVATLLTEVGIFKNEIPFYGYAFARTTRPGADVSELLRLFSASEIAGS